MIINKKKCIKNIIFFNFRDFSFINNKNHNQNQSYISLIISHFFN